MVSRSIWLKCRSVGLISRSCETVAEGLAQVNRYAALIIETENEGRDRFEIRHRGKSVWILDTRKHPDDFYEMTESTLARIVCTSRRWFRNHGFLKAVHFTHPEPSYRAEYDRIFGVPLTFGSSKNGLLVDAAWLSEKIDLSSNYVFEILNSHAEGLLRRIEREKSIRGRVEDILMTLMRTGDIRIQSVAARLGISRQTLYRKLKGENVTFEKVLDELRHRLALAHLSAPGASVTETAYLLGFSESAAFSRAFKRWTGMRPRTLLGEGDKE
jgi:AraC-like DNA-binding protein